MPQARKNGFSCGVRNLFGIHEERALPDGSVAPVGNTVDLATGAVENSIGTHELRVVWSATSPVQLTVLRLFAGHHC